ncbi:hypothetical protein D9758_017549 [Tetrapyrgos nigripes]|uniref:Gag protein n=1 Tax=Tetrapyrgos nigripes TaxID=182062 RepID=A0A8H5C683_9AGAR|nr:hypothetical protein D9758_017549 [Tetrapyrgos nigripes]
MTKPYEHIALMQYCWNSDNTNFAEPDSDVEPPPTTEHNSSSYNSNKADKLDFGPGNFNVLEFGYISDRDQDADDGNSNITSTHGRKCASVEDIEDDTSNDPKSIYTYASDDLYIEPFPGLAGSPLNAEPVLMRFEEMLEKQRLDGKEPWYLFASEKEWELAHLLLKSGVSRKKIDRYSKLESGIVYVLNTLRPGEIQIVSSPSPISAPTGTTGGTTATAAAAGEATPSDTGSDAPSAHFIAAASSSVADWDKDNNKAMGVIKLRVAQAIGVKIENITTTRIMWDTLKNLYGRPGAAEIFQNFKRAMNVEISRNTHPGTAIDLIKMYLTCINNAGDNTEIPMYLQYMIVINKLPPDIYAYIIAKITQDDVDDFEDETLDNLRTHVVNTWEARGRKKPQSANATKITAIKRKGKPPVFEEQQQQCHKGGSSAWRGKGCGHGNW